MNNKLSKEMNNCIDYMLLVSDKRLIRYPGGFWADDGWKHDDVWFNTSTIEALVKRGLIEYTTWKEGKRGGSFPIECKLTNNAIQNRGEQ